MIAPRDSLAEYSEFPLSVFSYRATNACSNNDRPIDFHPELRGVRGSL